MRNRSAYKTADNQPRDLAKRLPMLSSEFPTIDVSTTNDYQYSPNFHYAQIADGIVAGDGDQTSASAIPDVLRQAYRMQQEILIHENPEMIENWIGLICALLLADTNTLKLKTVDFINKPTDSLFKRAVSTNVKQCESTPPLQSITLYMYRTTEGPDSYVPVAFALNQDHIMQHAEDLFPLMVFPAAEISTALDCTLPWYRHEMYKDTVFDLDSKKEIIRDRYWFGNPLPVLEKSENFPEANALANALLMLRREYPDLDSLIKPYYEKIPHQNIIIADSITLRKDIIQGIGGAALPNYRGYDERKAQKMLAFLADTVCLFQRNDSETPPIQNAFYLTLNKSLDSLSPYTEAALPLNTNFADCFLDSDVTAKMDAGVEGLSRHQYMQSLTAMTLTEFQSNDVLTYVLQWTLDGHTVWKRYISGANAIQSEDKHPQNFPILAVWPRVKTASWEQYYTYSRSETMDNDNYSLSVYPGKNLQVDTLQRTEDRINPGVSVSVEKTSRFPEIILVKRNNTSEGLLILKPEIAPEVNDNSSVIIAMDFGTSNTIAYWRDPNKITMPVSIPLKSYLLPISTRINDQRIFSTEFLSADDYQSGLFISMLRILGRKSEGRTEAIKGSIIPFSTDLDIDMMDMNELAFKLKWYNLEDIASKSRTEAFLEQLILMYTFIAKMGGYKYIFWRFSWPRAMMDNEFANFKTGITDITRNQMSMDHTIHYFSEAQAVGSFFTSEQIATKITEKGWNPVKPEYGYASIDIGGGSVDISVWQKNALHAEASLRNVAADAVLCETIVHLSEPIEPRRTFLEKAFSSVDLNSGRENEKTKLKELLLNLLRQDPEATQDELMKRKLKFEKIWAMKIGIIADILKQNSKQKGLIQCIKNYLNVIEFYISALVFFTAQLVRYAIEEGKMETIPIERFSLLFSGNGSQMINLLYCEEDPGAFKNSVAYRNLRKLFAMGINSDKEPQIIIPVIPKHEVAFGMVSRHLYPDETNAVNRDPVLYNRQESVEAEEKVKWCDGENDKKIQNLTQLFDSFWDSLSEVYDRKFLDIACSVFERKEVLKEKDPLETCKTITNERFITLLQTQDNQLEHKDLTNAFSYVLRQMILRAHE